MYYLMAEYFAEKCSRPYYTSTFVITEGRRTVKGNMPSSTHLEADYRIVGHVLEALKCGYQSTSVRANDTDVLVILLAFMPSFLQINLSFKLILKSGSDGKDIFNINNICTKFGEPRCRGLLFFHAFTGCDYTSSFFGIGKTRWFDVLKEDSTIDEAFKDLSTSPSEVTESELK